MTNWVNKLSDILDEADREVVIIMWEHGFPKDASLVSKADLSEKELENILENMLKNIKSGIQ